MYLFTAANVDVFQRLETSRQMSYTRITQLETQTDRQTDQDIQMII